MLAVCLVAGLALSQAVNLGALEPARPAPTSATRGCAADALFALMHLLGADVTRERVSRAVGTAGPQPSMLQLRDTAAALGVALRGWGISLAELRQRGAPALLHLRDPDHYVTVAATSYAYALVHDGDLVLVMPWAALSERYSGRALLPDAPDDLAMHLAVPEAVRVVEFSPPGEAREESVTVLNRGVHEVPLRIESKSCACASADLDVRALKPQQRATVKVSLRPRAWGTTVETVILRAGPRRITLGFQLVMPTTARAAPERMVIRAQAGAPTSRALDVLLARGGAVTRWENRQAFVSVIRAAPGREGAIPEPDTVADHFLIVVSPDAPPGPFADEITFELKDAPVPRITVPVDGYVEPDVTLSPREVFLGMVQAGSVIERTVVAQSAAGRLFVLKGAQRNKGWLSVQAVWGHAQVRHEIRVQVTARGKEGDMLRDTVRVSLEDGSVLEFGVFAMIAPGNSDAGQAR